MNQRLQEAARLYAARDHTAAEAVCRTIVADDPRHFDALHLLGVLLSRQDQHALALEYLRRAEAEQPGHRLLRINLGNALLATQQFAAAAVVSGDADAASLNNLGLALRGMQRDEEAAAAFRAATELVPDYAPAWFNLAGSLTKAGRLDAALQAARTALRVAPPDTPVHRLSDIVSEIGRILMHLGQPEAALRECRVFLVNHPGDRIVTWNMSLALLLLGRFAEGWAAYEQRFGIPGHDPRSEGASVLDVARVAGKRILILQEQGRGDMLHFVRYAPLLTDRGAIVVVQAYPDLVPLLRAMPGIAEVVSTEAPRPSADMITPVMSLPLAFGTQPANIPYLRVPPEMSGRLDMRSDGRRRVGVAWSGSAHSYERSAMSAETLAPLFALPGFDFHCLQKDILESDRAWLNSVRPALTLHTDRIGDFLDTAALIQTMDVVVTIDTAVAHLAGSLAHPVHIMLPFNPDWRWLLNRSDSPWYPTARLHRQPRPGPWAPVVQSVIAVLTAP